ncbi:MAG TPA: DUF1684 domain-containing protein [Anaerolineae bacterium]|nr:DUF1684 domain-containing protein [Anaerolineae bacterium]
MTSYEEALAVWRNGADANLRQENGWLALVGLLWLQVGDNTIGRGGDNKVVLGDVEERWGKVVWAGEEIVFWPESGAGVLVDGEEVEQVVLRADVQGNPTHVGRGGIDMILIQRGERYGLRVWDNGRALRQTFTGRVWFDVDEMYCVEAEFVRPERPRTAIVPNALGDEVVETMAGQLRFKIKGQALTLWALPGAENSLFIIFKDKTSGQDSYAGGRYLSVPAPEKGKTVIDFNKAYSPPCVFTPYATCSFAPPENHLPIRIEAGEKYQRLTFDE